MIPIKLIDSTWPPRNGQHRSCLVLHYNSWNDYGYCTLFGMNFCDEKGDVHELGDVKIYNWDIDEGRTNIYSKHTKVSLGIEISQLNPGFCSLGQDLEYYKNIKKFLPYEYKSVLKRLNDIAVFEELRVKFINEKGVQTSLLRFSSAQKALLDAKSVIDDEGIANKNISFKYRITMPYDVVSTDLDFDFRQDKYLPNRIYAVVGKNGTGKTQLLTHLANSLSGQKGNRGAGRFVSERPPIDKVLSISYSAFDAFRKPDKDDYDQRSLFSYVYCGIQSEKGTLSLNQLKENLQRSFLKVKERGRVKVLTDILFELMEKEHGQIVQLIVDENFDKINLSSGQHILICTVTDIIANIENESIILFDEPEIHLHPNAIANAVRMFYRLLEEFNSYAIFSTHSPIILQEIPSKNIMILDRVEQSLTVRKPHIECFGNNISEIIFEIFDVTNRESNYKSHLLKLCESKSYDEILNIFDGNLSLHALIFLKNNLKGN